MKANLTLFAILLILFSCSEEDPSTFKKIPVERMKWPPYGGTVYIDSSIVLSTDSSTFVSIDSAGVGERVMFDRRVDGWVTLDAYLFNITYADCLKIEAQVNPEFTKEEAFDWAEDMAYNVGILPYQLRKGVETLWIHKGNERFGGGNNNILIHTGEVATMRILGTLEEVLFHEGAHSSLDGLYQSDPTWLEAQKLDSGFISTYAQENPIREDIAETIVPYFAVKHRRDRVSEQMTNRIEKQIPNRVKFLDFRINIEPH